MRHLAYLCAVLSVIGAFVMPWLFVLALSGVAAVTIPLMPLLVGVFLDVLYYPGTGLPIATLGGALVTAGALGVQYLLKTRILRA
jgi:hypothetical protein